MARAYKTGKLHKRDPKTGRIKPITWTPELKRLVRKLYVDQGMSCQRVADQIGCGTMTLYNYLKSLGLNRRVRIEYKSVYAPLEAKKKSLLKMYETQSAEQIASHIGIDVRLLTRWLKHQGVWRSLQSERVSVARSSGRHITTVRRTRNIQKILSLDVSKLHYLEYKIAVNRLTDYMYQDWGYLIDPKQSRSYEIHLDHVFSVNNAFRDSSGKLLKTRAPMTMIAHPANLRMLSRSENSIRHNTKDPLASDVAALKKRIITFERKHGDPFKVYKSQARV